ncbi:MAG: ABC transporter permease [Acidobacteriota bacterium]
MRRFLVRLTNVVRPNPAEREMTREIEAHLGLLQEDFERRGLPPREAALAAKRAYGGVEQAKELHRETRSFLWIEQFAQDVRHGARSLRKSPGFTLTAIAALALGIGATTAIFSIVNTMLLKPLPIADVDRLVFLATAGEGDGFNPSASPAMFAHWRTQASVFEKVSALLPDQVMNYTGGEVVEQWNSMRVSADFFRCLGVRILKGREFASEEDVPNGPPVAVIGQTLWNRRFAGDPAIIGKTVSLNGKPHSVIGVLEDDPAMAEFGTPTDVYVPFGLDPNSSDHGEYFLVMARLKPGVTLEQGKERLKASTSEFRARFPKVLNDTTVHFSLVPGIEFLVGSMRSVLLILLASVGLVLLIACANVANLSLVRAAGRQREMGIRAAIGAGRGRMIRQLLSESVLLALAGGAAGLWLGYSGMRALLAVNTADMLRVGEKGETLLLDWRLMGFAVVVSLFTAVLFGLLPALYSSRVDLNAALKDGGGRSHQGLRQNKARATLVVSEVALAVILLVGSSLLIRSFTTMYSVERGFETNNVVTMKVLLTGPKHATAAGIAATVRAGLQRIRAVPGVEAASATNAVPLQDGNSMTFDVIGRPQATTFSQIAGWTSVSPGFFDVFRIPVRRGRAFTQRDGTKSPPVVMINEAMAKKYWKDGDPLNDQIVIGKGVMAEFSDEPVRQIIGIVGDIRDTGLDQAPRPIMYVPTGQVPDAFIAKYFQDGPLAWVVRTHSDPNKLAPEIQRQLRDAIGLPVSDLLLMDEVVSVSTARQRFSLLLMSVFGFVALALAAIGIYGLMAYTVEQRTQEIGIRLALGAEAGQVRNMVLRQGMGLTMVGVAIGLTAAWAAARVLEDFLYGVKPQDPVVFAIVPATLGAVALFAVWLPARRALRVDPAVALRHE